MAPTVDHNLLLTEHAWIKYLRHAQVVAALLAALVTGISKIDEDCSHPHSLHAAQVMCERLGAHQPSTTVVAPRNPEKVIDGKQSLRDRLTGS